MRRARDRITELTVRSRLRLPVEEVVKDLNRFLRGWAGYFRYGNSAARFRKIEQHARLRLALFIGKRHKRGRGFGWSVLAYKSADLCGLLSLDGTVIAPRAAKPWRGSRMPAVNGVGKPCAGEPHARFDGRELETAHRSHQGHGDEGHQGKPCGHQRLRDLPAMRVTAPALDPPTTPRPQ